jgi:hypothetical protein
MFGGRLRRFREIPLLLGFVETTTDQKRAYWGVGKCLRDAMPGSGRESSMGVECRGPRLARGAVHESETVDPRRLRRGVVG